MESNAHPNLNWKHVIDNRIPRERPKRRKVWDLSGNSKMIESHPEHPKNIPHGYFSKWARPSLPKRCNAWQWLNFPLQAWHFHAGLENKFNRLQETLQVWAMYSTHQSEGSNSDRRERSEPLEIGNLALIFFWSSLIAVVWCDTYHTVQTAHLRPLNGHCVTCLRNALETWSDVAFYAWMTS